MQLTQGETLSLGVVLDDKSCAGFMGASGHARRALTVLKFAQADEAPLKTSGLIWHRSPDWNVLCCLSFRPSEQGGCLKLRRSFG